MIETAIRLTSAHRQVLIEALDQFIDKGKTDRPGTVNAMHLEQAIALKDLAQDPPRPPKQKTIEGFTSTSSLFWDRLNKAIESGWEMVPQTYQIQGVYMFAVVQERRGPIPSIPVKETEDDMIIVDNGDFFSGPRRKFRAQVEFEPTDWNIRGWAIERGHTVTAQSPTDQKYRVLHQWKVGDPVVKE